MTSIHKCIQVPYTPQQMFELINDIEKYPDFLPWCTHSEVHQSTDTNMEASLTARKSGINFKFTTLNELIPYEEIKMRLQKGPFKRLLGIWKFQTLNKEQCKITLQMEFEFSNKLLSMALNVAFSSIIENMLDAFSKRADELYKTHV